MSRISLEQLDRILPLVSKPARYTGGEVNAVKKDWSKVDVTFALAFPDIYDVGMGHLGYKILYSILNQRDYVAAERVYAPWVDMEAKMREHGLPLFSLESKRPIKEFDLVGFTLQYELSYTNILNMLDLAGIPLRSCDRTEEHPLIISGGPCSVNPEPLAPFLDVVYIGDGEEAVLEIVDCYRQWKQQGGSRQALLQSMAQIPGVYVAEFYRVEYDAEGFLRERRVIEEGVPARITRRVVKDLDAAAYPERFVVPLIEVVHDRAMVEVARGCTRGCRFCQAGMIYRPVRERSLETLKGQVRALLANTGYDEVSLTSLSTGDYTCIKDLIIDLVKELGDDNVALSLPSLRVDSFSVDLAHEIQKTRKTGLTFARRRERNGCGM